MAVVDTEQKGNASKTQGKVVDPFASKGLITGEAKKLNLENPDDAWARSAPPKGMERYDLKLYAGKESFRLRYEDENHPKADEAYYTANIECRIQSEDADVDNIPVFANVSTRLGRGKEISTMAALMVKNGKNPIPKGQTEATDLEVVQVFAKWLKSEPVVRGNLLDWKYSYQDDKGKWRNVYTTYADFPEDEDGERKHEFRFTKSDGSSETGNAQVFVREWGGKDTKVEEKVEKPVKKHNLSAASLASDDNGDGEGEGGGEGGGEEEVAAPVVKTGKGKPPVVVVEEDEVADL